MNTPLDFLLLCQSCCSRRNVSYGGCVLGLIKNAYHGWLSMMTSSEGPFSVLPRAPPTLNPPLLGTSHTIFKFSEIFPRSAISCSLVIRCGYQQWRIYAKWRPFLWYFRRIKHLQNRYCENLHCDARGVLL